MASSMRASFAVFIPSAAPPSSACQQPASSAMSGPGTATAPGGSFLDQFSRYIPDLSARPINAGHFFIEEAPETTNRFLLDFLKGRI
jgi:hypothetical protein